ncbi:MAG: hypothetical protein PHD48_10285 [Alphaproteobacteria bacterium]|nr:hypothetical protein [Alphaproteobacteria bacterium]
MALFDKASEPYEDLYSLYDALTSLLIWRGEYQGEDEEIEDRFINLTAFPVWRAPLDRIKTLLPCKPKKESSHFRGLSLGKAYALLQREKERILKLEFSNGNYPVFGYLVPRQLGDVRQRVPKNIWGDGAEIDWERSTVKNGGLAFEGIRLADIDDREMMKGLKDQAPTLQEPKAEPPHKIKPYATARGRGQPKKGPAVIKAYEDLKAEGGINFNATLNANANAVSDKTLSIYPELRNKTGKGIDVKTIRNAVGAQFDADQRLFLSGQQAEKEKKGAGTKGK